MLVREGNKIIRGTLEKTSYVKDLCTKKDFFYNSFVKPLHAELMKKLPDGVEPIIEYDYIACVCGIDTRKLGQKVKDIFSDKTKTKGTETIDDVILNVLSTDLCSVIPVKDQNRRRVVRDIKIKDAIEKVVNDYEDFLSDIQKGK